MQRARVDLPQPDSPTRPRVSPARSSRLTSSTACTRPTSRGIRTPYLIGKYFFTCSARSRISPAAISGPSSRTGSSGASVPGSCVTVAPQSRALLDELGVDGPVPLLQLLLPGQMAGVQMAVADPVEQLRALGAPLEPVRAPVGERAPLGQPQERRRQAGNRGQPPRPGPVQPGDRTEQAPGVGVLRVVEELAL